MKIAGIVAALALAAGLGTAPAEAQYYRHHGYYHHGYHGHRFYRHGYGYGRGRYGYHRGPYGYHGRYHHHYR